MWIKEITPTKEKRDTIHQYVEFKELHDNTRRKRANREWQNEIEMLKANRINSQIKQTSCNRQQTSKNKGRKNIHSCPNLRKMIQILGRGRRSIMCEPFSLSFFANFALDNCKKECWKMWCQKCSISEKWSISLHREEKKIPHFKCMQAAQDHSSFHFLLVESAAAKTPWQRPQKHPSHWVR